jgi:hypothetical protein
MVPANAAAAAGGYAAQPALVSELAGWRLLSGHESGQVLLWQVLALTPRPGGRSIQLMCVINEPKQIRCVVVRCGSSCGREAGSVYLQRQPPIAVCCCVGRSLFVLLLLCTRL